MNEGLNVKLIGCHDEEEDIKEQRMEEEEVGNAELWKHFSDVPLAHITIPAFSFEIYVDPFTIA